MKLTSLLFMFLLSSMAPVLADDNVTLTPTMVPAGATTPDYFVGIRLDNTTQNIEGYQMDITLPEGFAFYKTDGNPLGVANTDRLVGQNGTQWTIASRSLSARTARFVVSNLANAPVKGTTGELFKVAVVADAAVVGGNHVCTVSNIRLAVKNSRTDRVLADGEGYMRALTQETIALTVPEGGFATFCCPFNALLPRGLKAYKATGVEGDRVVLTSQSSIQAGVPMLIAGDANTYQFQGNNSNMTQFEYSDGILTAPLIPTVYTEGYVLQKQDAGLGFYKIAEPKLVPAYRCVLDASAAAEGHSFFGIALDDEEPSAVESIAADGEEMTVYTLDGKKVREMRKGQVYIINGVKVIIK